MLRRYGVICLALFVPLQAVAQEEQLDRPFVALFTLTDAPYPPREVESLRAAVEHERDQQIATCRNDQKRLRAQLDSARKGLAELNASSPRDSRAAATARLSLHTQISASEKLLRDKEGECEHILPATFEIQLAKARLLERWPQQREEAARNADAGRSRDRKHGDVDDIGFRKLADDQAKDISIGEQALRQMASSKLMPMEVEDAAVRQYVQELAAKLARNSDLKVPLRITVLDSAEINAAGLPGGFLFLTSGLILKCETEAEFAGVMSREIAHIAARHGTRVSKRSVISKMFVPAIQVATGLLTGGVSNAGAYYGMGYGFQGLGLLVDRTLAGSNAKAQKEADQLGIQYAWKAGFDPKGYVAFLDSVAKEKDLSKSDSFFLTKPSLGERLLDAFTEIQYLPDKEPYTVDSPEFRTARARLRP